MDSQSSAETPSSSWLVHQWIVAGIVSAASRFVPVPFVDDLLQDRCRRFTVERTLKAHDRGQDLERYRTFFGSDTGCAGGCLAWAARAPLKLVLFPIRKLVRVVTSVRGVPLEITRMVLLGRTLDRCLSRESEWDVPRIRRMRAAFEEAFARMDFHALQAAMKDVLRGVSGWKDAAIDLARRMESREQPEEEIESSPEVERSADGISALLDLPESRALFSEFDRRFDLAMERLDRQAT
ncbi:hypothetical protein FYK55_13725 [Roseiconus nitratireducens]|uniref:Uncharacterized protein n=1 Tax=Roseiconus nitratireducens TaxID=2605748 RepID=A0A5M6D8F7_9BACT|nr:hypothetical protein [Roseiconus nitratireducens]KAA5542592.1 hypothetical protein FYK55_13725 [Roseiconus nitratireducens]